MSKHDQRTTLERENLAARARRFRVGKEEGAGMASGPIFLTNGVGEFFPGDPALPERVEVHAVIEDALASLPRYLERDYSIVIEPFETSRGRCAILQDALGNRLCIVDTTGTSAGAV
jgi:hypothetical protein